MDMHEADGLRTREADAVATELFGSFLLGGDEFALPASCIREVVNYPAKVTALPLAPAYLEGMFTLRGSVIPVVNLGRLFRADAPRAVDTDKIAILDFQHVLIGIVFQDTGEILRVPASARSALQYAAGDAHAVIAGTILQDGARACCRSSTRTPCCASRTCPTCWPCRPAAPSTARPATMRKASGASASASMPPAPRLPSKCWPSRKSSRCRSCTVPS